MSSTIRPEVAAQIAAHVSFSSVEAANAAAVALDTRSWTDAELDALNDAEDAWLEAH